MVLKETRKYEDNLRFVDPNEPGDHPTRDFYVVLQNGEIAESDDPIWLLDAVFGYGFADCRVAETQMLMTLERLKNATLSLAMDGVYSQLYDAAGLLFDPKSPTVEFANENEPFVLDGWDAQTSVMSLIRAGRIAVFEKVPWLTGKPHKGCEGCAFNHNGVCQAWWNGDVHLLQGTGYELYCPYATENKRYENYVEATPERLLDVAKNKNEWVPISDRKNEAVEARRSWTDSAQ